MDVKISRSDLVCLFMVVLGFGLFLYGSNLFESVVGWIGVYLFLAGLFLFLAFYIYGQLSK